MERIAIIDHRDHYLYIEEVNMSILHIDYKDNVDAYIKDNYHSLADAQPKVDYDWEWIEDADYIPFDEDPILVDFDLLKQ